MKPGGVRVTWRGPQVAAQIHKAAVAGVMEACEYLLTESNKTVPHDTGALQESGETSVDEAKAVGAVAYGKGDAAAYAVRIHEGVDFKFQAYGGSTRRAKWLELTLREQAKTLRKIIADRIAAAHRG